MIDLRVYKKEKYIIVEIGSLLSQKDYYDLFADTFTELLEKEEYFIAIDLSKSEYINSTLIGIIMHFSNEVKDKGGKHTSSQTIKPSIEF